MKLSPNFSLAEFVCSATAQELGIDNTPSVEIIKNLSHTARQLEGIRQLLKNFPIKVTSGYRCAALNKAINGSIHSDHMRGYAADIVCPRFGSPLKIVQAIAQSALPFDQCINEHAWVHLGFAPAMRRQVLTATLVMGEMKYREGL